MNDRSRPLLLVFDRAVDMFPVLQHNGSYQALITDLLDAKLNKVTIDIPDKDGECDCVSYFECYALHWMQYTCTASIH